ncbi:hypothetical protein IV203_001949 [Nitzschia inconspicua]|uniref:Protein kinase domain-containing protein n=1 Tax=Nitzschia inconspicua TaxID=303405 RepID=A0A9K3L9H5_9STRA|nr:hypothetical protein IV203_001949 [Nitzschia inconspicua]
MILPTGYALSAPITAILLTGNVILQSTTFIPSTATTTFEFGNGSSVRVENPMRIRGLPDLVEPHFLGAGSGGAVFSYQRQSTQKETEHPCKDKVVVKFSWLQSAESVRNECKVLNAMEQRHISGIERCLTQLENPEDPRRTIIVMEPVVNDAISNLDELSTEAALTATKTLMTTLAQMLVARIVTADVQPLISKSTGKLVLIDMTEAKILPEGKLSDIDVALVREFCSEVISFIPDTFARIASETFYEELYRIEAESHEFLDDYVRTIIESLMTIE